ncbi:MAG: SDR family oxidoreductase [Gammaproteobacteria bacterium]|nr:SDR family oxidoreductase [Gammaproteobacteria bacterium]
MDLQQTRVLLTGATGGIGMALASQLVQRGASLALVGRTEAALTSLATRLRNDRAEVHVVTADLLQPQARQQVVAQSNALLGGVDLLLNCAGLSSFRPFSDESAANIEQVIQLNLLAPMLLTRELLPAMIERGHGRIVNVGSTFGSIGFAWFTAYSASKFGLRGFSEALGRELAGTGVGVTYVAPRAVRTDFNSAAVLRMAKAVSMNMDEPAWVAERIVAAIEADAKELLLGFPEKLFARLNGLIPRFVDGGLRKQNQLMERFARG